MTNTLRITSGTYRGRTIETPGGATHPMGERERLALFNMIASYIPDSLVLDAFAGSGALGFEALSRGAGFVRFIDNSTGACRTIQKNASTLGLESYEIIKGDVYNLSSDIQYDVVLADPPYDKFDPLGITKLGHLVANSGILALSHPGEAPDIPGLRLTKSRRYAGATISVFVQK